MPKKLTPQEQIFCQNYALTGNARQSALIANYSETNASQTGSRLLKRPRVQDEIKRIQATNLNEGNVTREMLQAFYIGIMRDQKNTVDQRLKASDFLNKLLGFYRRDLDILLNMDASELQQRIERFKGDVIDTGHKLIDNG